MEKETETLGDVKLSWLTRLAFMLGLGPSSHAAEAARKLEKSQDEFEAAVRGKLPPEYRDGDILPLVFYPNDLLKRKSVPVEHFDTALVQLVKSMGATMHLCGGVGLSAIQVGLPLRVIVADVRSLDAEAPGDFRVWVNPEILSSSDPKGLSEGCLSMPTLREVVTRPSRVSLRAQRATGERFEESLEGWPARVFLHEFDHLEGKVLLDRLGVIARRLAEKRVAKLARSIEINEEIAAKRAASRRR